MKLRKFILGLILIISAGYVFGQTNQAGRLFVPFLDKESQSNIIVTLDLSGSGEPCPLQYTNVLSNTNLFTLEEQKAIQEVFVKYKNVTTNSGPPGTELVGLYKTNYIVKAMNKDWPVEKWIANYQYTNSGTKEEIRLGGNMLFAKFRTESNDGYNVNISSTGSGPTLRFIEFRKGLVNGILVEFANTHQSWTNDYRQDEFEGCPVDEYRQYTNGLVLGNFLMWNPKNNNLVLEAQFTEPYEFDKHRIDLRMLGGH
jgi:hypothetical protein